MNKTLLLSPAGDMECAVAAINAGCDCIYLGGKSFSARSLANNFELEELGDIIDYAHLRDVKIYLTINTLYKNSELYELFDFVKKTYLIGIDAYIVQDIGTAMFIKKNFPKALVFASTQMTIHNLEGAKYLEELGFDRVVLSRELTLEEISYIIKNINIETEIFVHGALCVSYSGQCTMSSLIGGRSGNRGKCAQPCRQNYDLYENNEIVKEGYLLSPKDIMTLPILKDILGLGVTSLKIEGRMKDKEYVYLVTNTYKNQIEKILNNENKLNREDVKSLTQIFNRGGSFSSGYFETYSSINMMSTLIPSKTGLFIGKVEHYDKNSKQCVFTTNETLVPGDRICVVTKTKPFVGSNINTDIPSNKKVKLKIDGDIRVNDMVYRTYDKSLMDKIKNSISDDNRKIILKSSIKAIVGEPLTFSIKYNNLEIEKQGSIVLKSENKPISKEDLKKQLSKTGNTTFKLEFEEVQCDKNIFIRISDLNEIRRNVIDEFTEKYLALFKRENIEFILNDEQIIRNKNDKKITVSVKNERAFLAAITEGIYAIYIDYNLFFTNPNFFINISKENDVKIYISLPTVSRLFDINDLINKIEFLEDKKIDGYLIKNYGELFLLKNSGKEKIINYNFNILNNLSYKFFDDLVERTTLSFELNLEEINKFPSDNTEIIVYGKQPVMTLVQCPIGIYLGNKDTKRFCQKRFTEEKYYLKDVKNFEFVLKPNCNFCYCEVYNSSVLYMQDKLNDLKNSNPMFLRLEFLDEDENTIKKVINIYKQINNNKKDKFIIPDKNVTYGHFYRGIV